MQDKILELLVSCDGFVSGQEISEKLGVSRQAVSKTIMNLKKRGYEIESVTKRGHKLVSFPEYIDLWSIKRNLKTKKIGKTLVILESIDSSNDYLKRLADNGCPEGMVAIAREQTKGKGRLGRQWHSPKDEGITFSFLLRPDIELAQVSSVTPLVGLAVCRAIREYTGINCEIKWPNDIIVSNKKLVGILTEMSAEVSTVKYVVTGIGINFDNVSFPQELCGKATSVHLESDRHFDKNDLMVHILYHIEKILDETNFKMTDSTLREYTELCVTVGKNVSFLRNGVPISGKAVGIENGGQLKIEFADGSTCAINSGEVTVQGIY